MPYAVRLVQALSAAPGVELHLIVSRAAEKVLALESATPAGALRELAHAAYGQDDIAAPPASGSWRHAGMVVCPCSMASLAAIAQGLGANLSRRAADVALKEGRPLLLVPRETPLSVIHLKNMLAAAQAGAAILPACPGFYHKPRNIDDLVDQLVARILDRLGIDHTLGVRWQGGDA